MIWRLVALRSGMLVSFDLITGRLPCLAVATLRTGRDKTYGIGKGYRNKYLLTFLKDTYQ